jgi:DNA sulfur modification protein DndB
MASTFPSVHGRMGGSDFYCSVLTYGEAARLIQFVEEVDDWGSDTDPESKTQRKLNVGRVEREMVPYLLDVEDHFYSALTVEVRPPIRDDGSNGVPFISTGPEIPGGMTFGQVVLDGTETLYALDGQHRLKSIQLAIRRRPELAREQIGVIFVPFRSQRHSQLLFSDLNRYAKSPSKSISLLFSHRDPIVAIAKGLVERVEFLKDRVEYESTSLAKHTPNVVTLSTLYEMTKSLVRDQDGVPPEEEIERQVGIWNTLVDVIAPWREVVNRDEHPSYLRGRFLPMQGVCQQAIAIAVAPVFRKASTQARTLAPLRRVDWRITNPEWQGIAVQGRHISNTSTTVRNLAGVLSLKLGLEIDEGVQKTLATVFESRGDPLPRRSRQTKKVVGTSR